MSARRRAERGARDVQHGLARRAAPDRGEGEDADDGDRDDRAGGAAGHQRHEPAVGGGLVDDDEERADRQPRADRHRQSAGARPHDLLAGDEADQDDRDQGDGEARVSDRRQRVAVDEQPPQHRRDRRDDGGQRRQDAHRADREAGVQQGDRDDADDPGEDAPRDIGGRPHAAEQRLHEQERDESRQIAATAVTTIERSRRAARPPRKSAEP